jgi:hypothetical protein
MVGEYPNGTVVAGHANEDLTLFSIYRGNGNTDVYEIADPMPNDLHRVKIGNYIRTDYRS